MVLNNVTKFHIILIKNNGSLRAATVQLPHDPTRISILRITICITIHFCQLKNLGNNIIFCQGHAPGWDCGVLGESKTLAWGFAMAPHRLRALV